MKRTLGKSGIEVSALGLGCWAIGGPWIFLGKPAGWSSVDDNESIRAIQKAVEMGVNFFDTAANYGAGHSESILGKAIGSIRDKVVISTKFGYNVDEKSKSVSLHNDPEEDSNLAEHVRSELEASLRRLNTDYVDVYLIHVWGLSIERALEARQVLDALVKEGTIRTYGWSTDRTDAIEEFADTPNCSVIQQQFSVFDGNRELLSHCEQAGLASMNRGPLGMGILTGKFTKDTTFSNDDVRKFAEWHPGFKNGKPIQKWLTALDSVREVLTANGRTLTQGALAWIWGRSAVTIPIPGFKTVKQIEENCGAMQFGPLTSPQMEEIDKILGSVF
ncbi:aldo/keto reductase [Marispirochaeta aestuarii]|uniref:aldo/keto reductase n=1 Tax=Marispirochaeta aestuarii TaxID=1963862 RepID=UPI0029C89F55|nr:aldo/keto reductase [Marispirochaeta aestuarii]